MSTPMRIISAASRPRGSSICLVPGDAETHRGIDHADHAVGLREIPPQFAGARVDMLREQPVAGATGEDALGNCPGLVRPTPRRRSVDRSEWAGHERALWG